MRARIIIAVVIVGWAATFVLWFCSAHRAAMLDARDQAAIRLLGEFHCEFIRGRNIPKAEYLQGLQQFERRHEDYRLLRMFTGAVEQCED